MKTKYVKSGKCFFLTIALLLVMTQLVSAASLSLKVETVDGSGESIDLPIMALKCEGMGALQFVLTYDAAVVEAESAEAGSGLPNGMVEFNIQTPGQIGIALVSSEPLSIAGELVKVRFKLVSPKGGHSDVKIAREVAWTYDKGLEMLVTTKPGSVSMSPSFANMIPEDWKKPIIVGGIILFVLIFILLVTRRGKKTQPTVTAIAPPSQNISTCSNGGFCQKCGAQHVANANFCPKCGQPIG
jgi:cohesin domain-containing protein/zinc ribbon protein